jgi:nitrite reductase/ring-hydroxylating ferredoxin subunit
MRFYLLEKFINLHDGYRRTFKIDQHHLLLLQENGEQFLIEAVCPHRGHPLETATIKNNLLRCPLHNYEFDLLSGRVCLATEESCRALQCYVLIKRNTDLGVMLN